MFLLTTEHIYLIYISIISIIIIYEHHGSS